LTAVGEGGWAAPGQVASGGMNGTFGLSNPKRA
jgi:hypothetical protein